MSRIILAKAGMRHFFIKGWAFQFIKNQITVIKLPHGFSLWSENTVAVLALAERISLDFWELRFGDKPNLLNFGNLSPS